MTTFETMDWAKRYRAARGRADATAEELLQVLSELFQEIAKVVLTSADFYHRPSLVLAVHAVYQVLIEDEKGVPHEAPR